MDCTDFSLVGFREFYAVKALPNLRILDILRCELGFGFDCSSITELKMVRSLGAQAEDIIFTSNNTSPAEYVEALSDGGCILNLDDVSFVDKPSFIPELICFRYNPGTLVHDPGRNYPSLKRKRRLCLRLRFRLG